MSGSGRPTGIRQSMKQMRQRRAAFRKIRAADERTEALIPASPRSEFLARCSKAAHISARRTIAAATDLPPDTQSRSILPRVTWDFDASSDQNQMHHSREECVMSLKHPPGDSHEVA